MTAQGTDPTSIILTSDARQHPSVFAQAFNSGDPDLVEKVYEDLAVLVSPAGEPLVGEARREANSNLQGHGRRINVRPRHVFVADDIALLIVDWEISPDDDTQEAITGTATDVVRRGADGSWRYVIDNPFGIATGESESPNR